MIWTLGRDKYSILNKQDHMKDNTTRKRATKEDGILESLY